MPTEEQRKQFYYCTGSNWMHFTLKRGSKVKCPSKHCYQWTHNQSKENTHPESTSKVSHWNAFLRQLPCPHQKCSSTILIWRRWHFYQKCKQSFFVAQTNKPSTVKHSLPKWEHYWRDTICPQWVCKAQKHKKTLIKNKKVTLLKCFTRFFRLFLSGIITEFWFSLILFLL